MKDFFEKIQKMLQKSVDELKNFDWNELQNVETIGIWPAPVKLLLIILVFGGFLGGGFWFHIKPLQASLASVISEEETLRSDLELKAILAANLEAYRQQLADMQESFGALLRQLPGETEVPGLVDDITAQGIGSGLEFSNIRLEGEVRQEFYIELPINISVKGDYHDFGSFVSGVASLSRIVTLHNFSISTGGSRSELFMDITARTYRYRSDND
jgi:type IV pilus assembly protein PilO